MSWIEENKVTTGLIMTFVAQIIAFVVSHFNLRRDVAEIITDRDREQKDRDLYRAEQRHLQSEMFEKINEMSAAVNRIAGAFEQMNRGKH